MLVEGWNVGWDDDWFGNGNDMQFDHPKPDFDAEEVQRYAAAKHVYLVGHYEQQAFADTRGWRHLDFVETIGDEYARDTGALSPQGDEYSSFIVYQRTGDGVRLFYAAEMPADAADPGQDPRGPTDLSLLWNILDHTPEGHGTDWYPKLDYPD